MNCKCTNYYWLMRWNFWNRKTALVHLLNVKRLAYDFHSMKSVWKDDQMKMNAKKILQYMWHDTCALVLCSVYVYEKYQNTHTENSVLLFVRSSSVSYSKSIFYTIQYNTKASVSPLGKLSQINFTILNFIQDKNPIKFWEYIQCLRGFFR